MSESRAMLVSALPSVSKLDYMSSQNDTEEVYPDAILADVTRGAKDGVAKRLVGARVSV